ncbi:2-amino-4-hydroxy-6-hydroxymethyldihydropteridine diphosphokinase [Mesorhizobium sp. M8A.F.Ca.ET.165.01.1.1]|nr:2-amino-4-hydroxy-6-hydroxymethyldihydropteridine diphosphokinase [Mesorhizobium sp. M8A.F.Ca.ET.207.01.1.1]TGS38991.1 2-amino-4-hydroxy-6-hydroxymethyldihydropteridine diphosphokinase [Mesorhizobium sp. M8A.F.Ca.ET.182.01.1.1]TGS77272.1 2-amino-4-hydroxy-6-hydroxymethyldihydropteridine diphosphokinase [Mesorhizobium sp. M8A.F.Ca.ET.181.01.1.1]TGT36347.1 2-amino-4-hydroxy-6-hydroxymethyldihydropteridine diphosphokinase [Mesorhizobium sp. M8A.F.Ca.ET.165.01.1.1]
MFAGLHRTCCQPRPAGSNAVLSAQRGCRRHAADGSWKSFRRKFRGLRQLRGIAGTGTGRQLNVPFASPTTRHSAGLLEDSPRPSIAAVTDRVFVSNLCVHGYHGVLSEETRLGQKFFIDIDCVSDLEQCVRDDDYSKAVCYATLCNLAVEVSASGPFRLIETLGDRIAERVLVGFPSVSEVLVRIRKPSAPIAHALDHVGIEVRRARKSRVAFALGSNIGNKQANLRAALSLLSLEEGVEIDAVSHFYKTAAWGATDQDWFVNGCAIGLTSLPPRHLLQRCKAIESQIGRTPERPWGPRLIDIDVLFVGDAEIRLPGCALPHPEMFNRAFVLVPLAEIASEQKVMGRLVGNAVAQLQRIAGDVVRLDDPS